MQNQRNRQRSNEDVLRLYNLYIGGLMALVLVVLQAVLGLDKPDIWITISVIAFAAALPLLGGVLVVNLVEERYPYGPTRSLSARLLNACFIIGAIATFVGMGAVFRHISWLAAMTFIVTMIVAAVVYGWYIWDLER